jgi:hypothetical protein
MVPTTAVKAPEMRIVSKRHQLLALMLVMLALGMALASILGPLVLGLMTYRTSPTTLNQLEGSDAAALFVVAPLTLVTALLAARGHPAAPLLPSGVGVFALYTYAQLVIGQEYLRLPGNVEGFFPLLLAIFIVAEAVVVLAWHGVPAALPPPSLHVEHAVAVALLLVAVFLVVGQHLRPMIIAWQNPAALTEYASSPTPFWIVKLMDLGIIVPAALTINRPLAARRLGAEGGLRPVDRLHLPRRLGHRNGRTDEREERPRRLPNAGGRFRSLRPGLRRPERPAVPPPVHQGTQPGDRSFDAGSIPMRTAVRLLLVGIVLVHGLIHLMGAAKGLRWADVTAVKQPISRSMGSLWLVAALLVLAAGVMLALQAHWWWAVAVVAAVVSQAVIATSWNDANAGTLANIILFAAAVYGFVSERIGLLAGQDLH